MVGFVKSGHKLFQLPTTINNNDNILQRVFVYFKYNFIVKVKKLKKLSKNKQNNIKTNYQYILTISSVM